MIRRGQRRERVTISRANICRSSSIIHLKDQLQLTATTHRTAPSEGQDKGRSLKMCVRLSACVSACRCASASVSYRSQVLSRKDQLQLGGKEQKYEVRLAMCVCVVCVCCVCVFAKSPLGTPCRTLARPRRHAQKHTLTRALHFNKKDQTYLCRTRAEATKSVDFTQRASCRGNPGQCLSKVPVLFGESCFI